MLSSASRSLTDLIRVPVKATYKVVDGVAVKVSAEYQEVPAAAVAKILKGGLKK